MDIYVGNLPYSMTESELRDMFAEYGEVGRANIVKDKMTGRSKGFGFVEMNDPGNAQNAIKALDGKDLNGRPLKVNEAKPRDDRPPRQARR